MDLITEHLHRSPKLGLYYRDIRTTLYEDRKKRKQFYEDVREDQKAEFINREVIVHSPVQNPKNSGRSRRSFLHRILLRKCCLPSGGLFG